MTVYFLIKSLEEIPRESIREAKVGKSVSEGGESCSRTDYNTLILLLPVLHSTKITTSLIFDRF